MNDLAIRVFSAVIGGLAVLAIGYWSGPTGLSVVVAGAICLMIYEFDKLAFSPAGSLFALRIWYFFVAALLLLGLVCASMPGLLVLSLCDALFFCGALWLTRGRMANPQLLNTLTLAAFGLLYCVAFPSFLIHTLRLTDGVSWFAFLLVVVFSGDTFAYFGGILFGTTKLMPELSPKKTIAGAVFGLAGSALAGSIFSYFMFDSVPLLWVAGASLVSGFAGQMGDLTVSLLKRVAQVKDSGSIMPGHGGILDRVDGVLIASPVVYAFATLFRS